MTTDKRLDDERLKRTAASLKKLANDYTLPTLGDLKVVLSSPCSLKELGGWHLFSCDELSKRTKALFFTIDGPCSITGGLAKPTNAPAVVPSSRRGEPDLGYRIGGMLPNGKWFCLYVTLRYNKGYELKPKTGLIIRYTNPRGVAARLSIPTYRLLQILDAQLESWERRELERLCAVTTARKDSRVN
jgi:hypothetical protein